jgi:hypothetical protein
MIPRTAIGYATLPIVFLGFGTGTIVTPQVSEFLRVDMLDSEAGSGPESGRVGECGVDL